MDLLTTALAASSASLLKQFYPILKDWVSRKQKANLQLRVGETTIEVAPSEEVNEELVAAIQQAIEKTGKFTDNPISLSRVAVARRRPEREDEEDTSREKEVGAMALSISPTAVFLSARRRIDLVFRLNLAIAISLAVLLLGGIGGAIVSGAVFAKPTWALVFGGISVADIIGVYAFKPLAAINEALVATQRLDALHLRLRQQLDTCGQLSDLKERIKCQTTVWDAIQRELATLVSR